jgi:RimJ/RimL family protein N-acetyltransferase
MRVLRSPRPDDAELLYPLLVGSPVLDTLLWDGPTSRDAYLATWRKSVEATERGDRFLFTIEDAEGQPVGSADLRPMSGVGGASPFRADLGLWIGLPHQGHGLGTRAVEELAAYGFQKLGLAKIEASVFVGNLASRRIFEKAGFSLEGTIRNAVSKRGRLLDEWIFGIVRDP